MVKKEYLVLFLKLLFTTPFVDAQESSEKEKIELVYSFNEAGTHYVRATGLAQVWLRNTQMNPGTTIDGYDKENYTDISIRRLRFQLYGQLTDRVFFYTQFGMNNFNFHSTKYQGAFFHDAVVEFAVDPEKLSLGGGLTAWSGLTRYASPSIGSVLTLDAPLYQQATNGVNDQFVRKLSIYAKGQLGKLDYRVAVSQPMTVTGAPSNATSPTNTAFSFSNEPPKKQLQGYFKYMFLDKESNLTPYQGGTYLGTKSIFNVGTGIIYQQDALWALNGSGETTRNDMTLLGLDVFYENPLSSTNTISFYAAYTNYDFGSGYIRNVGVDNPGNGANTLAPGGFGNAFPMVGTGNTFYAQAAYLLGEDFITEAGKFQPFASLQFSDYDYLSEGMTMFEFGANYLIHGTQLSKVSIMYQSRPTYMNDSGDLVMDTRKGMTVLQYQISF